jgi:hypothetical protein
MTLHGSTRRFLAVLAAAPLVLFAAALLFSASVSLAAPNAPAGLLRTTPGQNHGFGGPVAASHLAAVHPIWREPAVHRGLGLHRIHCALPGAASAGISCFAGATAG